MSVVGGTARYAGDVVHGQAVFPPPSSGGAVEQVISDVTVVAPAGGADALVRLAAARAALGTARSASEGLEIQRPTMWAHVIPDVKSDKPFRAVLTPYGETAARSMLKNLSIAKALLPVGDQSESIQAIRDSVDSARTLLANSAKQGSSITFWYGREARERQVAIQSVLERAELAAADAHDEYEGAAIASELVHQIDALYKQVAEPVQIGFSRTEESAHEVLSRGIESGVIAQ